MIESCNMFPILSYLRSYYLAIQKIRETKLA